MSNLGEESIEEFDEDNLSKDPYNTRNSSHKVKINQSEYAK